MALPSVSIDLSGITQADLSNPFDAMWRIVVHGGWVPLIPIFLWGGWEAWKNYVQTRYLSRLRYVLLAIDIPKLNEQSPKAVEQLFAHLSGVQRRGNLIQRYWHGFVQPSFSFEVVSIGGFIQFLVRSPQDLRDLVEAAVYAQYPDAEISEIDDYVPHITKDFPNEYNLWGTELQFTKKPAYPIRTYPAFEHQMSQKLIDPMSTLLEYMSRLRPGEQIWLQLVITPMQNDEWARDGANIIKKLIGAKVSAKGGPAILDAPGKIVAGIFETVTKTLIEFGGEADKKKEREWPSLIQHMPPHEKNVIEAIGIKISKIAFRTKFRAIYLSEKDQFDLSRVPGMMGAIKQFNTLDLNGFKPNSQTKTSADYWFVATRLRWRKRRLYWGYRYRSWWRGYSQLILNIEELASLYHFPVIEVKAPLVKKIESKRGEPPATLPVADFPGAG